MWIHVFYKIKCLKNINIFSFSLAFSFPPTLVLFLDYEHLFSFHFVFLFFSYFALSFSPSNISFFFSYTLKKGFQYLGSWTIARYTGWFTYFALTVWCNQIGTVQNGTLFMSLQLMNHTFKQIITFFLDTNTEE